MTKTATLGYDEWLAALIILGEQLHECRKRLKHHMRRRAGAPAQAGDVQYGAEMLRLKLLKSIIGALESAGSGSGGDGAEARKAAGAAALAGAAKDTIRDAMGLLLDYACGGG